MNRIDTVFENKGRKALVGYVTVGYPSVDATLKLVPQLAKSGCDIIELGIPFSDPLADGATIQKASFGALQNGVTPQVCLDVAAQLRKKTNVPLVFMTYLNPVISYGTGNFCTACESAGVDGLIVPDLPPDEGKDLEDMACSHGVELIYLLAPTSTPDRIKLVAERSRGFIYVVSLTGVTGTRQSLPTDIGAFVEKVRKETDKPLCVGFGVSTPEQAVKVAGHANGVIIGSRLIQLVEKDASLKQVTRFVTEVRAALDG